MKTKSYVIFVIDFSGGRSMSRAWAWVKLSEQDMTEMTDKFEEVGPDISIDFIEVPNKALDKGACDSADEAFQLLMDTLGFPMY